MNVKTSLEMSKDISKPEQLITEHIDIWTSAILAKSTSGHGSSKKYELYGISKLRELILELAVRGKLVPQDDNDEPVSVILEKINDKKSELIKNGNVKVRSLPKITDEEVSSDLPVGWEVIRLGNAMNVLNGRAYKKHEMLQEGTPLLRVGNLFTSKEWYYSDLELEPDKYINNGDLIYAWSASFGPFIWEGDKVIYHYHIWKLDLYDDTALSKAYLYNYLLSITKKIKASGNGIAMIHMTKGRMEELILPIPPLAEQHRIVSKVDELMLLCDQLEQQTEASIDAHATLVEVLLATLIDSADADELAQNWMRIAEHFNSLFTTEKSIDALKQTVLQLAVMGKLVPQNPDEEPASILLEKLRKERSEWLQKTKEENPESKTMLKKLKKLSDASAPFEIPSTWKTAYLIDLCTYLVDCHNKTAPYVDSGIPIIRTSNIREREFCKTGMKYISEETYEYWSRRCPPKPEDIIFTREAPMGEAAIIPKGSVWCLGQRTMLIRPYHKYVSNQYLLLALTEPHLLERASEHAIGSTVKHLRVGDVENLNIPLPPLSEQHRIVAKVNELIAICDQLKDKIQQSQETQVQLTDALIDNALG